MASTGVGGTFSLNVIWKDTAGNSVDAFEPNQVYAVTIKLQAADSYARHVDADMNGFCDTCGAFAGCLITLDAVGGSCEIDSARTDTTDRLTSLLVPVRESYVFIGWYTTTSEQVSYPRGTSGANRDK